MFPFTPKERESITSVVELPKPQQKKFKSSTKLTLMGPGFGKKINSKNRTLFSFPNYQAVKKI